jgi:DNA-binding CsgD family transcriptional regulator
MRAFETSRTSPAAESIIQSLRVLDEDGGPAVARIMHPLRELGRFDMAMAYSVEADGDGYRLSVTEADGVCSRDLVHSSLSHVLRRHRGGRFGAYDPRCPEAWNRNQVVLFEDIARRGMRVVPFLGAVQALGLRVEDQMRVLVCEGPSLLAWVGGFRQEPFTRRDTALLRRIVPALQRRLSIERTLASAQGARAALDVALEAIPSAAWLVGAAGAIELANSAGLHSLEHDSGMRARLADAVARGVDTGALRVVPVAGRGAPRRFLVTSQRRTEAFALVGAAARRWGLSPRQQEVLALVVDGASNARIGAVLGIADRTVETHLTTIYARAQVASRSAVIAAILNMAS